MSNMCVHMIYRGIPGNIATPSLIAILPLQCLEAFRTIWYTAQVVSVNNVLLNKCFTAIHVGIQCGCFNWPINFDLPQLTLPKEVYVIVHPKLVSAESLEPIQLLCHIVCMQIF